MNFSTTLISKVLSGAVASGIIVTIILLLLSKIIKKSKQSNLAKELKRNKELEFGLLPTCTCGGKNELKWIQQNISNWKTMSCIYSKFETKQMY